MHKNTVVLRPIIHGRSMVQGRRARACYSTGNMDARAWLWGLRQQAASRRVTSRREIGSPSGGGRIGRTDGWMVRRHCAEICRAIIGGDSSTSRTAGARTPAGGPPAASRTTLPTSYPAEAERQADIASGGPHRPDPPRLPPRSADLALLPHVRPPHTPADPEPVRTTCVRARVASCMAWRGVARPRTDVRWRTGLKGIDTARTGFYEP